MRAEIHLLLRYLVVFAVVLTGVIAFPVCAEGPSDACMLACCGGVDRSRLLGRLLRGMAGGCLSAVTAARVMLSLGSSGIESRPAAFLCTPGLLRASSLRI